jgi:hypothetical protein
MTSNQANAEHCSDLSKVDDTALQIDEAVATTSTESTTSAELEEQEEAERELAAAKLDLRWKLYISSDDVWHRYLKSEYQSHQWGRRAIGTTEEQGKLWIEYFRAAAIAGYSVSEIIEEHDQELERREAAEAKQKAEAEQRWREENPEAYAQQLKEAEEKEALRIQQQQQWADEAAAKEKLAATPASTTQPKKKRGQRGKDKQQRQANPKAWINEIAQLGFNKIQLSIALCVIGLLNKNHNAGKGGAGINRERIAQRYNRSLRTVETVIARLRDAGVLTVERAKPQLAQKYGKQFGQFGRTSLTPAFRNGTWQPQKPTPEPQSQKPTEPQKSAPAEPQKQTEIAANPAVRIIFSQKIDDPSDQLSCNGSAEASTAETPPKTAVPLVLSYPLRGFREELIQSEGQHGQRLNAAVLALAEKETEANSIHPLEDLMIKFRSSQTRAAINEILESCGAEDENQGLLNPEGSSNCGQDENQGLLNPQGPSLVSEKLKPVENHPERASAEGKAEIQPTAPLNASEELVDISDVDLGELFGPCLPFGSKIYIKSTQFSAPSLATVATADQLINYQIANKSIPVDHLVVVTIAGVTKAMPCGLLSARE